MSSHKPFVKVASLKGMLSSSLFSMLNDSCLIFVVSNGQSSFRQQEHASQSFSSSVKCYHLGPLGVAKEPFFPSYAATIEALTTLRNHDYS